MPTDRGGEGRREAWIEGPDRRVASHVADTWDIDKREDTWT